MIVRFDSQWSDIAATEPTSEIACAEKMKYVQVGHIAGLQLTNKDVYNFPIRQACVQQVRIPKLAE
mgnify:FL=1